MNRIRRTSLPAIARAIAVATAGFAAVAAAQEAASAAPSLYERLGGLAPISVVVDDFIDTLVPDAVLNANPAIDEARKRVPAPGLKYRVTELVCEATGGPCTYTGTTMVEAHAHLNIGEREWQAMLADLRASLDAFDVPGREQRELIAIVESTKADIVTKE